MESMKGEYGGKKGKGAFRAPAGKQNPNAELGKIDYRLLVEDAEDYEPTFTDALITGASFGVGSGALLHFLLSKLSH